MNLALSKPLERKSFNLKSLVVGAAVLASAGTQALALDFSFFFENSGQWANAGSPTDIVYGRILGLHEGNNYQQVTVWVDSVVPALDPDFAVPGLPHSWTSYVDANVTGGLITYANFSATDAYYAIRLNGALFSLDDFTQGYSYGGNVTFTPLGDTTGPSVPDGGTTVFLLGIGLSILGLVRRKMA